MMDKIWQKLLELKSLIDSYDGNITFCHILLDGRITLNKVQDPIDPTQSILIYLEPADSMNSALGALIVIKNLLETEVVEKGALQKEQIQFLQIYLPYCFFRKHAFSKKRAITVAHFAQTLDGKIATTSGHSKWIGNDENLRHAHRMRALCDAIMVGSGTVKLDNPKLTVRLVTGKNPHRVVLGNSCEDFTGLLKASPDNITVIGKEDCSFPEGIDYYKLGAEGGQIKSEEILKFLYTQGISSVYLEGGPQTTSNFIKDKKVDVLQLHLAPMLFGSGKQAIKLPDIELVKDGIQFEGFRFWQMGNAVMFAGCLM
jgi:diaminohydroxyphosphoribosylaminopyrimidine deaminase/5-amino-6-(5-phosphoribosylamino)uracil reductase